MWPLANNDIQGQQFDMAEAALVLSIFKIAGYAVDIATGLKAVASAIGQAGSEVRMIANEITNTSDVLSNLGTVLKSQGRRQPDGCRTAVRGLDI